MTTIEIETFDYDGSTIELTAERGESENGRRSYAMRINGEHIGDITVNRNRKWHSMSGFFSKSNHSGKTAPLVPSCSEYLMLKFPVFINDDSMMRRVASLHIINYLKKKQSKN